MQSTIEQRAGFIRLERVEEPAIWLKARDVINVVEGSSLYSVVTVAACRAGQVTIDMHKVKHDAATVIEAIAKTEGR